MKVWIIGNSNSGKSTFAKYLSEISHLPILEAGSYARKFFGDVSPEELSSHSLELLKANHRYFSNIIGQDLKDNQIIVGARNPIDFADLFDPKRDSVVILEDELSPSSDFEAFGIAAIVSILDFFLATGLICDFQVMKLKAKKENENWYV